MTSRDHRVQRRTANLPASGPAMSKKLGTASPVDIRKSWKHPVNLDYDLSGGRSDPRGGGLIKPVNVALPIGVGEVRSKSSADSISNLPALCGRDAVAMKLVTLPVLKDNGSAAAGSAVSSPNRDAVTGALIVNGSIGSPSTRG